MRNIFDYKDNLHVMDHIPAILKWGNADGPKPDVSILMPVYNHPQFFKLALETALNQDYDKPYEIVVLDNNMDDDVDNVNEFEAYVIEKNSSKILYYKNEHNIEGINSYNRLPQLARADYFTFLHDDDELCPNCLSSLFKLKAEKKLTKELIVPSIQIIDKDSQVISSERSINTHSLWGRDYKMLLYDWFQCSYTNGGGVLHHRQSFIDLGGYNSEYIPSADYAFYTLYTTKFGAYHMNRTIFKYRWAENDMAKVYEQCAERDYQFRSNMVDLINLPYWLLMSIMKANYNIRLAISDVRYKGETHRPISIKDKFYSRLAVVIKFLLHLFR